MKYIITFGSNQLQTVKYIQHNPMRVMLVIEADTENEARKQVMNSFIGEKFCTSYKYDDYAEEFRTKYDMREVDLETLIRLQE